MKARFLIYVCLLLACSVSLFAQTLTMSDSWTETVNAAAANTSGNNQVLINTINPNQSWNTGLPANGNTLLQIKFSTNTNPYLANTPIYISNVLTAKLVFNSTYGILSVQLTPAIGGKKHQHDIDLANAFLAMKPPTKTVCLKVDVMNGNRLLLANGMVVAATGNVSLLPAVNQMTCVCGKGLPPASGSDMEQFSIETACEKPKK